MKGLTIHPPTLLRNPTAPYTTLQYPTMVDGSKFFFSRSTARTVHTHTHKQTRAKRDKEKEKKREKKSDGRLLFLPSHVQHSTTEHCAVSSRSNLLRVAE